MDNLPIPMDIIQKRIEIPKKIAKLSYKDEKQAIYFIRLWGEKRLPISELHEKICKALEA